MPGGEGALTKGAASIEASATRRSAAKLGAWSPRSGLAVVLDRVGPAAKATHDEMQVENGGGAVSFFFGQQG